MRTLLTKTLPKIMPRKLARTCALVFFAAGTVGSMRAEQPAVVLDRDRSTVELQAYAPNIIRVTLSAIKASALAAPGYGFVAQPTAVHCRKNLPP
jgi:alpha-D-xyloside xylohydrolase